MDSSEFALHARLEDSHWWFTARRAVLSDILSRFVPRCKDRLLAEIGCGTGGNLRFFSMEYRVIGCDISPDAIAYARQRVSCPIFLGDFAGHFDPYLDSISAFMLLDVLEHVEDDTAFLRRIVDYLKPGSTVMLTVPAHMFLWSNHDETLGHRRRYETDELKNLWKDLPVETLFFSSFNMLLFPFIAFFRLLGLGNRREGESNLKGCPTLLNRLLHHIFAVERFWLKRWPLPFGISYCAVLKKIDIHS